MTSRREQIMLDALREIARRDTDGSGRFAQQVLDRVDQDDAAHMDQVSGYDKERGERLTNMAAQRMGDGTYKTSGPMSVHEIETGPGNKEHRVMNWDAPKQNLQPQFPEKYVQPPHPHGTEQREAREQVDRAREEQVVEQEHPAEAPHELSAESLTVDKAGGGFE